MLHDWSDDDCVAILKNCTSIIGHDSRLLIIETVIEDNTNYHIGKDIDIVMLALFGGKERSVNEFTALFSEACLQIASINPIPGSMLSIIELIVVK